jgi:adenine-specific DNA-methyltransferase
MSLFPATLNQYFTPLWADEALVERYFARLGADDMVIEPSCGEGAFLAAIPANVPVVGVELDPVLANTARRLTGRDVVTGDFRTVPLKLQPTAIIGNPPFTAKVFQGFLDRAHGMLPDGAVAGFILPAYMLKHASVVEQYRTRWSLQAEQLPVDLFPSLSKPLLFCLFRKDRQRALIGLALYEECAAVAQLHAHYQALLRRVSGSAWATAVAEALLHVGGEGDLEAIYRAMERRRPTSNQWWKEKVRQVLQERFERRGPARYGIPIGVAA